MRGALFVAALACALCVSSVGAQGFDWRQFANQGGAAAPSPAAAPGSYSGVCPPPGFDAVPELNVTEYISAPWFVLAQTPLVYQPADQLYCTRAQYVPVNPADVLEGVRVINVARKGGVDGPVTSTGSGPSLLARVPDRSRPSKLSVGFDFPGASQLVGTQSDAGPYWVVAIGQNDTSGSYEWAVVASGPPTIPGADGCKHAEAGVAGVWLFSRSAEDPELLEEMLATLQDMGVDTQGIMPVVHEDCVYEN